MKIKISLIVLMIILGGNIMSCVLFAGILYPKVVFSFRPLEEQPPGPADARLAAGSQYPQTFTIFFSQAVNTFKKSFIITLFVNKPYEKLHIKELSYEWDGGQGIFLTDKTFELEPNTYRSKDDWYWKGGLGEPLYSVNFERIFKQKKPGDRFRFTLKLVYSFDEEPDQTQILEYEVVATEGEYIRQMF